MYDYYVLVCITIELKEGALLFYMVVRGKV